MGKMTERERILKVFQGEVPDRVPYMLDLSHYYYHKFQKRWELFGDYSIPEYEMIDYNRSKKAGFYIPNQASFFKVACDDTVQYHVWKETHGGMPEIHWKYETPYGTVERVRVWEPVSYSWAPTVREVNTEDEIRVLAYALSHQKYMGPTGNYEKWVDYVGDDGVVYCPMSYSAMGEFLGYWMGIENTIYNTADYPDTMHEAVDAINSSKLDIIRGIARDIPCEVIIGGDNFHSSIQPPSFFREWSMDFYKQFSQIVHEHGKKLTLHVDGWLRGAVTYVREAGADGVDAITPSPMGDLTPAEIRAEAGDQLILSGGVAPNLWYEDVPMEVFRQACIDWVELSKQSTALIAAAGDQVPPGAEESRIDVYREVVEEYGYY